ncbi:MAG: hypothetical protein GXP32_02160, partial [Kiritimatiellaeota bacterium]|nr:hypothetical protein [Kiritimatiellota bacterium]
WINRPRLLLALSLIVCGVVWTIDNHPFSRELGFSQYADAGTAPFQKVIDYVESRKNATSGIIWSAPEAEMRCVENGVALTTLPYLSDVKGTFGHNGMAGLYGDAVTALRPGGEWDSMLKEYCDGVRRTRPIIVGELDYHGRKRRIDMYQTVVRNSGKNRRSIFDAIVAGRSYAYAKPAGYGMELTSASLKSGSETAGLGDVLNISDERLPLVAALSLKISGSAPKGLSGRLKIIVNGIIVAQKMFSDKDDKDVRFEFPLEQLIESWKSGKPGYVRFDVAYGSARIATNPIFIRHGGNGKEKMTAWKDRPTF